MSAFLKIFTDASHTSEVAHTTAVATTLSGAVSAGATSITVASAALMPAQGTLDIIDATNGNETLAYSSISGTTINLMAPLAHLHPSGCVVNQWYYALAVGDQTNGIVNDGSASTPVSANTATWYLYNAGDQTAQNVSLATSNTSPSTAFGFSDTQVSITSSSTGFAASVSPANLAASATQQFWIAAQVPGGQGSVSNPQICVLSVSYQTV